MSSKPAKVLIIAPTPFFADRGCHTHIAEQVWALQRQGKQVHLVTYGIGRDLPGITTSRTWQLPWYKKEAIGPSWHKFYVDIFLLFTAIATSLRFKPHIIHSHLHEGCLIGFIVSRLFNIPLVFDCQGSLTGELIAHQFILAKPKRLRSMWYAIEKKIDHLPDIILAQSTEMRRELIEQFAVQPNNIIMAFDGVNTHTFQPQQKDQQLLKKLDLPSDQPIIVYLGGLTSHKGVDSLLQAFRLVLEQQPNVYLLLMGYPNEDKYHQRAQDLNISHRVCITGRVRYEDAPRYLALGDIAVAPKRTQTEANGKIYNYMATGLPTVAFDTVVNRNILGDLGVYTNPEEDYQGLASALIKLLPDKPTRTSLAQQSRAKAVAKYSWDDVASRIIKAYHQIQRPWQIQVFNVSIRKKVKWLWLQPYLSDKIRPDSTCIDIGCGVGTLSYLQEKLGGSWQFTEIDPKAAEQTSRIVQGPVHQINIFDPKLRPNTYDIITVLDVIEHVPDPQLFMHRVYELLKPGGHAFITTPADDSRLYLIRYLADKLFHIDQDSHGHVTDGFSREQLISLFNQAKLKVIRHTKFSKFFTELIELAYNAAYITKNRTKQSTTGYNLALSPASQHDFTKHKKILPLLRLAHPVLRAISALDILLPTSFGYEWGIVVKKPNHVKGSNPN